MKHKRISLAAGICWLLLMIGNCAAMVPAPAGDMDCCDPVAVSCCEPASTALAYKFESTKDSPTYLAALDTSWPALIEVLPAKPSPVDTDWHHHTPLRRLHLLNCSFLI